MLQKLLFILIPILCGFTVEENTIEWSASRKLTWNDFKGTPDASSPNAALTNSSIKIDYGYNNKGLTYSIKCTFNKSLSWGRIKNDHVLNHEQGHFDIAEIHARILHKELTGYRFNGKTVEADVSTIYSDVMQQQVATQQLYDLQTHHSLDSAQQTIWNEKIATLLKEYEKYSDYN